MAKKAVDNAAQEKAAVKKDKQAQELDALRETVAAQQAQLAALLAQQSKPIQPMIVSADVEKVHFLWMAEVADDNITKFGENGMYGKLVGKTGSFYVPKADLSRVMDSMFQLFLKQRWVIVLSGLSQAEREALGVDYRQGELLDRSAFARMVDMGEEILPIYGELCDGHKEMVAKQFYAAYRSGSRAVTRELAAKLKELSATCESAGKAFAAIISEMNAAQAT